MKIYIELVIILVGIVLIFMSKGQPFPEISRGFGVTILIVGLTFFGSYVGGREVDPVVISFFATLLGGVGVIAGIRHLGRTKRDVIVAPISSILLSIGTILLLSGTWEQTEGWVNHLAEFSLAVLVCSLSVFLVFRGLLVGGLQRGWSQAGLRQLHRGLLDGPNGAISCFERAWDPLDPSLDAMSHAALEKIYEQLGDQKNANYHTKQLNHLGGISAVDEEWLKTVETSLKLFSQN